MKGRGTRWKAVILDYDLLSTYDDDEDCIICLSPRQAMALLGYMRGMEWSTRWENLPPNFDLAGWVADIEGKLINVSCGNCGNDSSSCICELTQLMQTFVYNQYPPPVITPDNPGENVPGVDPIEPEKIAKRDATICEVSQIIMSVIFDNMRLAVLAECNGENPLEEFGEFAKNAGNTSMTFWLGVAGITAATGGAALLPVLGAAALASGLLANVGSILEWNPLGIGDECGDPGAVPEDVLIAYSCQLYTSLIKVYNFTSFRNAMNTANDQAIAYYESVGLTTLEAIDKDASQRDVIINYLKQGDIFKTFTLTLGNIVEDPFIEPSECNDCIDCASPTPPTQVIKFDDALIESIEPVPDITNTSIEVTWTTFPDEVVFTFTRPVCINRFRFLLNRGATVSVPDQFIWFVGIASYTSSAGGFGDNSEDEAFGNYARQVRLLPGSVNSGNARLSLQLPNVDDGFVIRDVNP